MTKQSRGLESSSFGSCEMSLRNLEAFLKRDISTTHHLTTLCPYTSHTLLPSFPNPLSRCNTAQAGRSAFTISSFTRYNPQQCDSEALLSRRLFSQPSSSHTLRPRYRQTVQKCSSLATTSNTIFKSQEDRDLRFIAWNTVTERVTQDQYTQSISVRP